MTTGIIEEFDGDMTTMTVIVTIVVDSMERKSLRFFEGGGGRELENIPIVARQ